MRRKTEADYLHVAAERGFTWVGSMPPTVTVNTTWQCANDHRWQAAYHDVRRGNGCPHCYGHTPLTATDYASVARLRGFVWLGPMPEGSQRKTGWQCPEGHVWQQTYANIAHKKSGCPACKPAAMRALRQLKGDAYHQLAQKRGFLWLGPTAPNSQAMTRWQCSNGHEWASDYNNIYNGSGCPHCDERVNGQPVSRPQLAIHEKLGGVLNHPVGRYRLDVALLDLMIAVEYDGWYWHDDERDAKRDRHLKTLGWRIIRVKSATLAPSLDQLRAAIAHIVTGEDYTEIVLDDWPVAR